MRHATPEALDRLEALLLQLRRLGVLREKKRGTFYRGASAFLHFHEDPAGLFADVRLDGNGFARRRVSTQAEQRALLAAVRRSLGAGGAPRSRAAARRRPGAARPLRPPAARSGSHARAPGRCA